VPQHHDHNLARRDFLKSLSLGAAGAFTLGLPRSLPGAQSAPATAPNRPNIIIFLVDDMGWQDTSVPFHSHRTPNNDWFHTPHMDRLARQGMKFTDAYAVCPVCSPTRISLLTGQSPARTRITDWIGAPASNAQARPENEKLIIPPWNAAGLQHDAQTLPRILKANGYKTWHVGKAHFAAKGASGADPRNLGFDVNVAGTRLGHPGSYYAAAGYKARNGGNPVPDLEEFQKAGVYLTDALTIVANRLIDAAIDHPDGQPFFLHMAHYAVHAPIEADPNRLARYRDRGMSNAQIQYASMIESMDASLGSIMDKLQQRGIADNTIILFFSDNGGLVSHSGPPTTNAPLRAGKGSAYEGGTRVPLIVKQPGIAKPGSVCYEPVISDDIFPTVLSMAGIDSRDRFTQGIDGRDLSPLLQQTRTFARDGPIHWHFPHYWGSPALRPKGSGVAPYSAIRRGPWKLIHFYEEARAELYDLEHDIGEQKDLAAAEPAIARRLADDLRAWLLAAGAQLPVDRVTQQPVPPPAVLPSDRKA